MPQSLKITSYLAANAGAGMAGESRMRIFTTMKLLLEIPDNKAASFLEVIKSISFVKAEPLTDQKAQLLSEVREAVDEMKQIVAGRKEARKAADFLREL